MLTLFVILSIPFNCWTVSDVSISLSLTILKHQIIVFSFEKNRALAFGGERYARPNFPQFNWQSSSSDNWILIPMLREILRWIQGQNPERQTFRYSIIRVEQRRFSKYKIFKMYLLNTIRTQTAPVRMRLITADTECAGKLNWNLSLNKIFIPVLPPSPPTRLCRLSSLLRYNPESLLPNYTLTQSSPCSAFSPELY